MISFTSCEAEPCISVLLVHLDLDLVRGLGAKPSVETATQVQVQAKAAALAGYGSSAFDVKLITRYQCLAHRD